MAVKPAPLQPKGKSGGLLSQRVGGVPLPLLLLGVAAAIGVGLYLRHRAASTPAAATSSTPASASDTSGGSGAGSPPADLTPVEDLAQSINGLIPFLGAGSGSLSSTGAFSSGAPAAAAAPSSPPQTTIQFLLPSQTTAPTASPTTSPASSPVAPTVQVLGPTGQVLTVPATTQTNQLAAYENPPGPYASLQQQQQASAAAQTSLAGVSLFPPAPNPPAQVTPKPTPSTYGITYGAPAGKRASGGSIH